MKQPAASAARPRGGEPVLANGSTTVFWLGSPPPRIVIGQPSRRLPPAGRGSVPLSLCPRSG